MMHSPTLKKKRLKRFLIITAAFVLSVVILCIIFVDNKNIEYDYYSTAGNLTTEIKIAHLSDLHFPKIRVDLDAMLDKIKSENPDFIAITGDIVDSNAYDISSCGVLEFIEKAIKSAPVYYANGNHEKRHSQEHYLYGELEKRGVNVLINESVSVEIKGNSVTIIGIDDNDYESEYSFVSNTPTAKDSLRILLAHRPERQADYLDYDDTLRAHIILSGHAHGGQVRFFGQGLVAPGQGLLPKFTSGQYKSDEKNSTMFVSRGLGNSILPLRFNNKPHILFITVT